MRILLSVVVFFVSAIVTTIACTWGWEMFIKDHLYNCTDDVPLDYLHPGDWVHHAVSSPVVSGHRSMSEPDVIMQGWSLLDLWVLWLGFIAGSFVVSFLAARLPLSKRKELEQTS
jgi:hypothetical protein